MEMHLDLPPGATLYGSQQPPVGDNVNLGDFWNPYATNKLFRLMLGDSCPTCKRPGLPVWHEVSGGIETLQTRG